MRKLQERLTYANVISTLALFVALGGGAYAAIDLVGKNDIKSRHIAPNAVKGKDAKESSFGIVPRARTAEQASTAGRAATAGFADTAERAGIADDVDLFEFAQVAADEETDETEPADLATPGPSVTVNVPADGLVAVFAQADLETAFSACEVFLLEDGLNMGRVLRGGDMFSPTIYTRTGSSEGSREVRSTAGLLTFPATQGAHTYKLAYAREPDATTCSFSDRKLWVAPVT